MLVTRFDRKAELARKGISNRQIAREESVDESLVSHVVAGRRLTGDDAQRVMRNVAAKLGAPVDLVFPERRKSA